MHSNPLRPGSTLRLKHTTQTVRARVVEIRSRIDVERLESRDADSLPLNAIGEVLIETTRPLIADLYRDHRSTGSFILIDPADNATAGAGMIRALEAAPGSALAGALLTLGNRPALARDLEEQLLEQGALVVRTRVVDRGTLLPLVFAGAIVLHEGDSNDPITLAGREGKPLAASIPEDLAAILGLLENARTLSPGEDA
jgi:hypothetical protein